MPILVNILGIATPASIMVTLNLCIASSPGQRLYITNIDKKYKKLHVLCPGRLTAPLSPLCNNPLEGLIEPFWDLSNQSMAASLPYLILCFGHVSVQPFAIHWLDEVVNITRQNENLGNSLSNALEPFWGYFVGYTSGCL